MNALDHSPIPVGKVLPPHARTFIPVLESARAQPCYAGQDEVADYAQTMLRPAVPADPDDVFSQDEDYDDALDVGELLSQRPAPTPNGKWVAIAMDACSLLIDLQSLIAREASAPSLCEAAQRINPILAKFRSQA